MRIGVQGDMTIQSTKISTSSKVDVQKAEVQKSDAVENNKKTPIVKVQGSTEEQKDGISKGKLEEAVDSINEFLHTQQKSSKFVFHEGLDKYYVKLVDAETDEVIKEIPPEKLLNAFYEMKKLAGMIVDEKI